MSAHTGEATTQAALAPKPDNATSKATIEIPASKTWDDLALIAALARLVNDVYATEEGSIYKTSFSRTSESEIQKLLQAGELAVAFLLLPLPLPLPLEAADTQSSPSTGPQRTPVGCVCIKKLSATTGEFGMLAVDPVHRGAGLGADLVRFAEAHCRRALGLTIMRLDLLVPLHFEHAGKTRLQVWYTRLGYEMTGLGDFEREYPELYALLAGPTEYRVFEKNLVE
ncbi:hypothetical protein F5Y10DRAFT_131681 [Nemania abortiva]|nr:hypothetical protein F5Y10DRAFT_131681 [Nemania abortiva]